MPTSLADTTTRPQTGSGSSGGLDQQSPSTPIPCRLQSFIQDYGELGEGSVWGGGI